MTTTQVVNERLNGINMPVLKKLMNDVETDPAKGLTHWGATTRWVTGALSETEVAGCLIGGKPVQRRFSFRTDEPHELGGGNTHANPQEYLMGAFNACMVVGYVALSSLYGIELDSVEIQSEGEIDLRGFFGMSEDVKPGYEEIHYTVRIKGNGTLAQFREIHEIVMATSPNRYNLNQPIKLTAELVVN